MVGYDIFKKCNNLVTERDIAKAFNISISKSRYKLNALVYSKLIKKIKIDNYIYYININIYKEASKNIIFRNTKNLLVRDYNRVLISEIINIINRNYE